MRWVRPQCLMFVMTAWRLCAKRRPWIFTLEVERASRPSPPALAHAFVFALSHLSSSTAFVLHLGPLHTRAAQLNPHARRPCPGIQARSLAHTAPPANTPPVARARGLAPIFYAIPPPFVRARDSSCPPCHALPTSRGGPRGTCPPAPPCAWPAPARLRPNWGTPGARGRGAARWTATRTCVGWIAQAPRLTSPPRHTLPHAPQTQPAPHRAGPSLKTKNSQVNPRYVPRPIVLERLGGWAGADRAGGLTPSLTAPPPRVRAAHRTQRTCLRPAATAPIGQALGPRWDEAGVLWGGRGGALALGLPDRSTHDDGGGWLGRTALHIVSLPLPPQVTYPLPQPRLVAQTRRRLWVEGCMGRAPSRAGERVD